MTFQSSVILASTQNAAPDHEPKRRSANYIPSIWGDRFLLSTPDSMKVDEKMEKEYQQMRQQVKGMLNAAGDRPSAEILKLIDVIQRLGVSYHFETEIDEILQQIYNNYKDIVDVEGRGDLFTTATCFRLLRQQGYNVSSDVFKKFKDEGNFKETLVDDVQGMLSLYEATHLRVHAEDLLEEALNFTTTHLRLKQTEVNPWLAQQVAQALKQPIRKSLPRIVARRYISVYQEDASRSEILLNFAKLDFNILQKIHQRELSEISRWWKDLDVAAKFPFARDRLVECYFWILGVYFEPQYGLGRRMLNKVISMTSIMDDVYDVHGTFEELQLFTQAVQRWDISCIDQLPKYMKHCYGALLKVYEEIEQVMTKNGKLDCFHYVKQAMKRQAQSYFLEAKWSNENYIPTVEEYMGNSLVSSGYSMLLITSFIDMGDLATKEVFEWVYTDPKIVRAATIICRLMDDLVSTEFEQKRGHVASGIHCYMKQHGVLEEEVHRVFRGQVEDAWKDINEELLRPTEIPPRPLLVRALNFARVIDLLYKDEDAFTHVGKVLRDAIASLLIDPVPY